MLQQFQGQALYNFPGCHTDPMFNAMAAGIDIGSGVVVGVGGGMLEQPQLLPYEGRMTPPLDEFTNFP